MITDLGRSLASALSLSSLNQANYMLIATAIAPFPAPPPLFYSRPSLDLYTIFSYINLHSLTHNNTFSSQSPERLFITQTWPCNLLIWTMRWSPMNSGEKLKFHLNLQVSIKSHPFPALHQNFPFAHCISLSSLSSHWSAHECSYTRVPSLNVRMPAILLLLFAFILKAHHPVCIWVITIPSSWFSRTYPPALIFGQFRPTQ